MGILKTECQGQKISIEALIVKDLKHNLLSASKLTSKGHKIIVEINKTTITGKNFSLTCEFNKGLYLLRIDKTERKDKPEQCNMTVEQSLWHRRLGHPGNNGLVQLQLPTETKVCSTCMEGKGARCSFKNSDKRTTKIGELIHTDIYAVHLIQQRF